MLTATSSKCMARNKPSLRFSLLVFSVSHSRSPIGAVVLVTWSVRLMLFTRRAALLWVASMEFARVVVRFPSQTVLQYSVTGLNRYLLARSLRCGSEDGIVFHIQPNLLEAFPVIKLVFSFHLRLFSNFTPRYFTPVLFGIQIWCSW